MTRAPVHAGRAYLYQDLVGGDNGFFDLRQAQAIGGAVGVLNDRPHLITPRRHRRGKPRFTWLGSHGDLPFGHGMN
jgi:hypothetical protein